jgi:protein-L-isoaspartate(D-aspartate) O-methyltransferase
MRIAPIRSISARTSSSQYAPRAGSTTASPPSTPGCSPRPAARPRQHFLHIGAGYYTAVLAELVGSAGRATAFEVDKDLAARARRNFSAWPQESGALA